MTNYPHLSDEERAIVERAEKAVPILAKRLEDARAELAGEWVRVEDRLPAEGQLVFFCVRLPGCKNFAREGKFSVRYSLDAIGSRPTSILHFVGNVGNWDIWEIPSVSHWMPRRGTPEPPKEQK